MSPGVLLILAGTLVLVPIDLAHLSYDSAEGSQGAARLLRLERAVRLDPHFPLYRFRLALATRTTQPDQAMREALLAASQARGVAALWLEAGVLAHETGAKSATDALVTACRLNRLAPLAPFFAALSTPNQERGAALLAQALLLEPQLAAAVPLEPGAPLLDRALVQLEDSPQLPLTWRLELKRRVAVARRRQGPQGRRVKLVLDADRSPYLSFSVYAFRRRPWPARLASVVLWRSGAKELGPVPRLRALRGLPRSMGRALSCGSD